MKQVINSQVQVFTQGKHADPSRNEDSFTFLKRIAVVDGATDKSGKTYTLDGESVTAGKFASQTIVRILDLIPPYTSVVDQVRIISQELDAAIKAQYPDIEDVQRPSAVMSVFDPYLNTLWMIGDTWMGYEEASGEISFFTDQLAPDDVLAPYRAYVNYTMQLSGRADPTIDAGRQSIMEMLKLQGVHANNEHSKYGYGVLDGRHVPKRFISEISLKGVSVERIVLATDGYPHIVVDGKLRLDKAEQLLASIIDKDPQCVDIYKSTKGLVQGNTSFDDRTWIEITFQPVEDTLLGCP